MRAFSRLHPIPIPAPIAIASPGRFRLSISQAKNLF